MSALDREALIAPLMDRLIRRFNALIEPEPTSGCWLWRGGRTRNGYGAYTITDRRRFYAHRISYVLWRGPIAEGLDVDHKCRVRACVNPDHLEPVTRRENLYRGQGPTAIKRALTHCLRGHPFDEQNTYRYGSVRYCRACKRARVGRL